MAFSVSFDFQREQRRQHYVTAATCSLRRPLKQHPRLRACSFAQLHPRNRITPAEMAKVCTTGEAISFCNENDEGLSEVIFPGGEDELGMNDEEHDYSEPEFEPLEVPRG